MTIPRLGILCLLLAALSIQLPVAHALPLENGVTFQVGTFVIPMDEKQAERIVVYGFVDALLRFSNNIRIFRVIEPPDVTLSTNLSPSPKSFTGGPFLVYSSDASSLIQVKSRPEFMKVTVGTLTTQQTLNSILRITEPTKTLVVKGLWGRTDLTLDAMMIPYTITTREDLAANPNMVSSYSLVVIDSFGWDGYVPSQVVSSLRNHVSLGNGVIFTDIALKDMNATFPGYVTLWGPLLNNTIADSTVYSPPKKYGSSTSLFSSESPSQYYNLSPHANEIRLYSENAGYAVSSVPSARVDDVRILVDSNNLGTTGDQYGVLAFYFQYGRGIVEGLAFNPQKQTEDLVWANGYYTVFQLCGNMLLQGSYATVGKYDVTVSLVGLPKDVSTTLQVDGVKTGNMNGNDVQVLSYPTGTSHTIQVDQYVSGTSGYRYYCASNIRTVTATGSSAFNYLTQVHLDVDASPLGAGSVAIVPYSQTGWYNAGTSVQATAKPLGSTHTFVDWVLDNSVVSETSPLTINMSSPHKLTAVFGTATSSSSSSTESTAVQTTGSSTSKTTSNLSTQTSTITEIVTSSTTTVVTETKSSETTATATENPSTTEGSWTGPVPLSAAIILVVTSIGALVVLTVFRVRRMRANRPIPRTCPDCGFTNPPYTKAFCVKCGSPLEAP